LVEVVTYLRKIKAIGACADALAWAKQYDDGAAMWAACVRPDWMEWLLDHVGWPDEARKAYDEAVAPARKAYDEAVATAIKAYDEAVATTSKAYAEAVATTSKAYDEAVATAIRSLVPWSYVAGKLGLS
jgi:hypothetical protein